MSEIRYQRNLCASQEFRDRVTGYLLSGSYRNVCDIGGGRNPLLPIEQVRQLGLNYSLLDISAEELNRAPGGYEKVVADISAPEFHGGATYDFVFSRMLAEHVSDGRRFHQNVYKMLAPGGVAFHYFPTLFTVPFFINKLLPETLASGLLDAVRPRDRNRQGKFPARYSWCYGPTPAQLTRLRGIGYEILEYTGLYGHGYYQNIPIVRGIHAKWMDRLVQHPNPHFTSFAFVLLRKPAEKTAPIAP